MRFFLVDKRAKHYDIHLPDKDYFHWKKHDYPGLVLTILGMLFFFKADYKICHI